MQSLRVVVCGLVIAVMGGCESPTPPAMSAAPAAAPAVAMDAMPISVEVTPEPAASDSAQRPANDGAVTTAEEITLQAMTWTEVTAALPKYAGKVVVIDVWSTSCEPCLREFPHLIALQQRFPKDVVCIGLNCDYVGIKRKPAESYREKVLKVLQDQNAKIVNVLCTLPSDDLFGELKISSIPAVFVYGRDGALAHTFDNRTPAGDGEGISYEKQIDPAVAELVGAAK